MCLTEIYIPILLNSRCLIKWFLLHLLISSIKKISDGKFSAVIWDMNKWQCALLNSWVIIVNYNVSLLINEHKINSLPSWSLFALFQAVRQITWCISQETFSLSPITSIIQIAEPLLKIEEKKPFPKCMCKMPLSYFQGELQNYQILSPATFFPLHCMYIGMMWWMALGDILVTSHLAFSALWTCPAVGFLRVVCQVQMSLNSR